MAGASGLTPGSGIAGQDVRNGIDRGATETRDVNVAGVSQRLDARILASLTQDVPNGPTVAPPKLET